MVHKRVVWWYNTKDYNNSNMIVIDINESAIELLDS